MAEKRQYISHKEHKHPATKKAREKCRISMSFNGEPWDGVSGINTRSGASAARVEAPAFEEVTIVEPEDTPVQSPKRDSKGRYMRMSLAEWRELITSLEQAEEYLTENATLLRVEMQVVIGGQTFKCSYDGHGWEVGS